MKNSLIVVFACFLFASCKQSDTIPVKQQSIQRIDEMPDLPQPLQIGDVQQGPNYNNGMFREVLATMGVTLVAGKSCV